MDSKTIRSLCNTKKCNQKIYWIRCLLELNNNSNNRFNRVNRYNHPILRKLLNFQKNYSNQILHRRCSQRCSQLLLRRCSSFIILLNRWCIILLNRWCSSSFILLNWCSRFRWRILNSWYSRLRWRLLLKFCLQRRRRWLPN